MVWPATPGFWLLLADDEKTLRRFRILGKWPWIAHLVILHFCLLTVELRGRGQAGECAFGLHFLQDSGAQRSGVELPLSGNLNRELRQHERGGGAAICEPELLQQGLESCHNVASFVGAKHPGLDVQQKRCTWA
jgi:hypothetical protein